MYLRRYGKRVDGEDYGYWSLVESVRTARGPRQRVVATIGKLPDFDKEERLGWEEIGRILTGKPQPQHNLFKKTEEPPSWATVNINRVSVERLRNFGDIYLALHLWHRLGFAEFCKEQMPEGRETIPWSIMACILTVARFCSPSSELKIAESWYNKTAMDDLMGVSMDMVNDDRLYRALDALLPHKDALCRHLQDRYGELFGETFDFLFYDVTSTYFEGTAIGNPQAKRGYSRDSRPDCPQVCIGLVTSREGLPLAFEVFDGNRTDVTTIEEMVVIMESKYGKANRIWVMDRGMVSEGNIEFMQQRGARYIVGTSKSMLKKFEQELLAKDWEEVHPDPKTIWKRYIQLTEVEDAFRTEKHDLGMRPIYHQKQDRTQAHILVCFLSLAMWRTLQQWMKASGLGTAPRKLIEEMREVRSLDVLLPAKDKTIRLRVVSTPSKELKVLLQRMKILLPNRPKIFENVVKKIA